MFSFPHQRRHRRRTINQAGLLLLLRLLFQEDWVGQLPALSARAGTGQDRPLSRESWDQKRPVLDAILGGPLPSPIFSQENHSSQ